MASLKRPSATDRDVSPPAAKRKLTTTPSTTSSAAVANFFKPTSQKIPDKTTFQILANSLLIARYENAASAPRPKPLKIAAFDFDGTLIRTKSGNVFARGAADWQWWDARVPGELRRLSADGYAVVVVSNQSGISLQSAKGGDKKSLANFREKVADVLKALDLPITLYAATERDAFRKPRTGIWERVLADYGLAGGEEAQGGVCASHSVFVGDAAGREGDKAAKIRKDHSCCDRDFAANVGIAFHTPEEYFLGEAAKPFVRPFDPTLYTLTLDSNPASEPVLFTKTNALDLVLLCGSPGAGKSTFFRQHLAPLGYARVNQDTLKTRERCVKAATQLLQDERASVAVDNTNADVETRAVWVRLAAKLNVPVRVVLFTAEARLCEHNDAVRALAGKGGIGADNTTTTSNTNPENRSLLPKMAFSSYASRFREPRVEEGFEDITRVDFVLRGTAEERAEWGKFWIS